MDPFGILVLVSMIVHPNGSTNVVLTDLGLSTMAECHRQRESSDGVKPPSAMPDGSVIMSQTYACMGTSEGSIERASRQLDAFRSAQKTFGKPLSERLEKVPAN